MTEGHTNHTAPINPGTAQGANLGKTLLFCDRYFVARRAFPNIGNGILANEFNSAADILLLFYVYV